MDAGNPLDDAVLVVQRKVMAAQIWELEVRLARFALRTVECDGWCESRVKFRRRIGGLIRDLEEAREQLGEQEHMMEWMRQIPRTCGRCGDREREVERMQQRREEEEAMREQLTVKMADPAKGISCLLLATALLCSSIFPTALPAGCSLSA